jgi:hypothetical protein
VSFFNRDIIAPEHTKYVYTTAGAIVGGVMFGMTGRWSLAITWDIIAVVACWLGVRLAEAAGGYILEFFSFVGRLLTFRL